MHNAHAGVMARARTLLIRLRTTSVFLIFNFVTSTQLLNREFLAFPSVNFFQKSPHFLSVAIPLYCPFFVKISCKSLIRSSVKKNYRFQNIGKTDPMFLDFKMFSNIVNIKWHSLKTFHRGK